jgi:hypothetical protein
MAHSYRIGAQPVLSDSMKAELLKHFPGLKVLSENELPWCNFDWIDIDTNGTHQLKSKDLMVT